MTAIDAYLAGVARGLAGMDRRVREDIVRELRAHLTDAAEEGGEDAAVAAAESPAVVAARYKDMYGYGRPYQAIFVALAIPLAVLTLPLLLLADEPTTTASLLASGGLVALVAYLMIVAVKAGSRVGLVAGVVAAGSRFGSLAVLAAFAGALVPDAAGLLLFTASSIVLVPIGFLPGAVKSRWKPRDVGL